MQNPERRPRLRKVLNLLRRLFRREPASPPEPDPYAYVTAPVRRGPKGRSGAAVAEIEDDSDRTFPPIRHSYDRRNK
jgi:hypothetical protein